MRVEVAVVGLGPVGGVLAALLVGSGHDVVVVDPSLEPVPTPRAVALDDEVLRLLAMVPRLPSLRLTGRPRAELVDARDRLVAAIDFDGSRNAQPGLAFFAQPLLEADLRALLGDWHLADEVRTLTQDAREVRLGLASGAQLTAEYVVGCDGAASTVRRLLGVGFPGRTLPQRWLVVDAAGEPIRDVFRYHLDPAQPAVSMPVPGGFRWERLLDPGVARAADPAVPAGLRVTRAVEYAFHARAAERWRVGRVLLAGDAAHAMPPFAGQGLGAGLRDARALWWRLGAALRGDDRALDDYEPERRPHVRAMTRTALLAGGVLQTRTPAAAAAVRGALRAAGHIPWFARGGLRPRDPRLAPNSRLEVDGEVRRLDELVPFGERVALRLLPDQRLVVGAVVARDLDGWLAREVRRRGGAVDVRPDRRFAR